MVYGVESVVVGAVDVKDGDDFSVSADGDDDLAFRGGGTGDVPWELVDIRDDERLVLRPSRAADTFVIRDAGAGNWSLKRTENEFLGVGIGVGCCCVGVGGGFVFYPPK